MLSISLTNLSIGEPAGTLPARIGSVHDPLRWQLPPLLQPPVPDLESDDDCIFHVRVGKRRRRKKSLQLFYKRSGLTFVRHFGSINGLICLDSGQQLHVLNLSTRESLMLPPPPPSSSIFGFSGSSCCSLGFDPCSNTYKILRTSISEYSISHDKPIFQVFTLGSDTWREVVIDGNLRGLGVGGSLYWNINGWLVNRKLLAFGVAEERFRLLPHPSSRTCVSFLGRLDGRLAAVEDNSWLMSDQTMDLWILLEEEEDDDRNGVWSLMQKIVVPSFRIDVGLEAQPPGMAYPKRLFGALETIHGGQLVIVWHANWGEEAYIYASCYDDLESRLKSLWKPREAPGFTCCTAACHYVESMVSLREIISSYKP